MDIDKKYKVIIGIVISILAIVVLYLCFNNLIDAMKHFIHNK